MMMEMNASKGERDKGKEEVNFEVVLKGLLLILKCTSNCLLE
jgi:hypothetical protein